MPLLDVALAKPAQLHGPTAIQLDPSNGNLTSHHSVITSCFTSIGVSQLDQVGFPHPGKQKEQLYHVITADVEPVWMLTGASSGHLFPSTVTGPCHKERHGARGVKYQAEKKMVTVMMIVMVMIPFL